MTEADERQLIQMVTEMYHHLGLDGKRPLSLSSIQKQSEEKILKWKAKSLKKDHECAAT
jgi:hypothetical protein